MISLLIVDNDEHLLHGLRRLLNFEQKDWSLEFAHSGEMALEKLSKKCFDVLVTDMNMPGINGVSVLQRCSESSPDTLRIAISGHFDILSTYSMTTCSHLFLKKPFQLSQLIEFVKNALYKQGIEFRRSRSVIDRVVQKTDSGIFADLPREERQRINKERLQSVGTYLKD